MLKCVEGEVELGDEPDQHVACWNMYNYFGKDFFYGFSVLQQKLLFLLLKTALDNNKELRGPTWNLPSPDTWVWVEGDTQIETFFVYCVLTHARYETCTHFVY